MHEISLVRSLLQQAGEIAATNGCSAIDEIRVEIGPLAGVEPLLVRSAFNQLAAEFAALDARIIIDEVPLEMMCHDCDAEFVLKDFRFACPECGSRAVRVIRGDEFRLVSVTVHEPEHDLHAAVESKT